jgi:hypothetical protein
MESFTNADIQKFRNEDFIKYRHRKIKLFLNKENQLKNWDKKGKEFIGYYDEIGLAFNKPNQPVCINFIEDLNYNQDIKAIENSLSTEINLSDIELIQILGY